MIRLIRAFNFRDNNVLKIIRTVSFLSAVSLFSLGPTSPAWPAKELVNAGDFTKIAQGGFRHTIGGVYNLGPILQPNVGSGHNSYSWSMGWYDADADGPGKASLYVGTVRDVLCAAGSTSALTQPCPQTSGSAFGFGPDQRAEIWRYDPSVYIDYGGANGSWTRVYRSPFNGFAGDPILTEVIPALEALTGTEIDFSFDDVPRDVGYRNQSVCKTFGDDRKRLYATTSGIPGNILYINDNGTEFLPTSHVGLKAELVDFVPKEIELNGATVDLEAILSGYGIGPLNANGDIGYRGLACFNGYLITSPSSSVNSDSEDVSENPFLLGNWDPSGDGDWGTLVDFRNFPSIDFQQNGDFIDPEDTNNGPADTTMGDLSNYGAFDINIMGGDLWVAVSNRGKNGGPDRGGVELWRGDGAEFGSECDRFNPALEDDGCAGIVWNKVIDVGAGRREDALGPDIDNALGTFGVLDGKLYMALWESGFENGSLAELIRINPVSDTPGSEVWELLIGGGRLDYENDDVVNGTDATGVMVCDDSNRYDESTVPVETGAGKPDCYPSTGRHAGFGSAESVGTDQFDEVTPPNLLNEGGATYFWRLGSHLNAVSGLEELYMGTYSSGSLAGGPLGSLLCSIGLGCEPNVVDGGFELYKTTIAQAGEGWSTITQNLGENADGFGNPFNYGVRSILSVQLPDAPANEPVLFIGSASPYTNVPDVPGTEAFWGGTEVFMGTDILLPTLPPLLNVTASDGVEDKLTITWDSVPDAIEYIIFRSRTADLSEAQKIASVGSVITYDDISAKTDTIYYYWVKAITDTSVSEYGLFDSGFMKEGCFFYVIKAENGNVVTLCL